MAYTIIAAAQWPAALDRREASLSWIIDHMNEASPIALDGTQQFRNSTGGPLWRSFFNSVQLRSKPQVLAWQALEALLEGGKTPIDVPLMLCRQRPQPLTAITVVADMAARAVAGRINIGGSGEIAAGMHFADYDATTYGWRLYRITTVAAVVGQPTQRDITFLPPLRFPAAAAHALEFDNPRQVMRLAKSDAMQLELRLRKRGDPSASFVEAY